MPKLAHDVAVFWMLQGFFERALTVFRAVLTTLTEASDRLLVLSSIARSAGGAGRIDVFANAWVDTWEIIDDRPALRCVTSSLMNLAYGSASLGDWERVELAARHAHELAGERHETRVQNDARALLAAAAQHRWEESRIPPPDEPAVLESADHLAGDLVRRLAGNAGKP